MPRWSNKLLKNGWRIGLGRNYRGSKTNYGERLANSAAAYAYKN